MTEPTTTAPFSLETPTINFGLFESYREICDDPNQQNFHETLQQFMFKPENLWFKFSNDQVRIKDAFVKFLFKQGGCPEGTNGKTLHSKIVTWKDVPFERLSHGGVRIQTSSGDVLVGIGEQGFLTSARAILGSRDGDLSDQTEPIVLSSAALEGTRLFPFHNTLNMGNAHIVVVDGQIHVIEQDGYMGSVKLLDTLTDENAYLTTWNNYLDKLFVEVEEAVEILEGAGPKILFEGWNSLSAGEQERVTATVQILHNTFALHSRFWLDSGSTSALRNTPAFQTAFRQLLKLKNIATPLDSLYRNLLDGDTESHLFKASFNTTISILQQLLNNPFDYLRKSYMVSLLPEMRWALDVNISKSSPHFLPHQTLGIIKIVNALFVEALKAGITWEASQAGVIEITLDEVTGTILIIDGSVGVRRLAPDRKVVAGLKELAAKYNLTLSQPNIRYANGIVSFELSSVPQNSPIILKPTSEEIKQVKDWMQKIRDLLMTTNNFRNDLSEAADTTWTKMSEDKRIKFIKKMNYVTKQFEVLQHQAFHIRRSDTAAWTQTYLHAVLNEMKNAYVAITTLHYLLTLGSTRSDNFTSARQVVDEIFNTSKHLFGISTALGLADQSRQNVELHFVPDIPDFIWPDNTALRLFVDYVILAAGWQAEADKKTELSIDYDSKTRHLVISSPANALIALYSPRFHIFEIAALLGIENAIQLKQNEKTKNTEIRIRVIPKAGNASGSGTGGSTEAGGKRPEAGEKPNDEGRSHDLTTSRSHEPSVSAVDLTGAFSPGNFVRTGSNEPSMAVRRQRRTADHRPQTADQRRRTPNITLNMPASHPIMPVFAR